jgi:hypothetical protein
MTGNNNNKEERESISNAVASLPPAQVSYQNPKEFNSNFPFINRCLN